MILLCDIEGTTTSILFVKDTLFPFIRSDLAKYLDETWDDVQTKADVELLRTLSKQDNEEHVDDVVVIPDGHTDEVKASTVKSVQFLMDNDRKVTALKQLQGHMWKSAYENGLIKGHVYGDVKPAMERWIMDGQLVMIYSSGSVQAQKLLFKFSEEGDMTTLLSGYFDTTIGAKVNKESYINIAKTCGEEPSSFLFLSDRIEEIEAASEAGMHVAVSIREGNLPIDEDRLKKFPSITSFSDIMEFPAYRNAIAQDRDELSPKKPKQTAVASIVKN
eukprot:m.79519 g.79519  ORF g.79519 m.79519 type:complete len:275 (+) comp8606_c0_seq2:89-913(+)